MYCIRVFLFVRALLMRLITVRSFFKSLWGSNDIHVYVLKVYGQSCEAEIRAPVAYVVHVDTQWSVDGCLTNATPQPFGSEQAMADVTTQVTSYPTTDKQRRTPALALCLYHSCWCSRYTCYPTDKQRRTQALALCLYHSCWCSRYTCYPTDKQRRTQALALCLYHSCWCSRYTCPVFVSDNVALGWPVPVLLSALLGRKQCWLLYRRNTQTSLVKLFHFILIFLQIR